MTRELTGKRGTRKKAYCLGDVAQQLDGKSLSQGAPKGRISLGSLRARGFVISWWMLGMKSRQAFKWLKIWLFYGIYLKQLDV